MSAVAQSVNQWCNVCYGYGMWPGENIPLIWEEAKEGIVSDICSQCGSENLWAYKDEEEEDMTIKVEQFKTLDEFIHHADKATRAKELVTQEEAIECGEENKILPNAVSH